MEELGQIEGVQTVDVNIETGEVVVCYQADSDKRSFWVEKLQQIGYPEKTEAPQSSMFDF